MVRCTETGPRSRPGGADIRVQIQGAFCRGQAALHPRTSQREQLIRGLRVERVRLVNLNIGEGLIVDNVGNLLKLVGRDSAEDRKTFGMCLFRTEIALTIHWR